jgi:hypothetical protein
MWRRQFARLAAAWCLVLAIVACGPALATPTPTSPAAQATQLPPTLLPTTLPLPTQTATLTPAATATTARASASPTVADDRLYLLAGEHILVLDATTGAIERTLPAGVPTTDWQTLYAVAYANGQTTVSAIDVATGATLRATTLAGRYGLPYAPTSLSRIGLSRNGRTLVLAYWPDDAETDRYIRENRWLSRFAVLDTTFQQPARTIELEGNFSYDTLAPVGPLLYLIEHRPPVNPTEEYAVRVYDLAAGALRPGVVVDKSRVAEEEMEGFPVTQVVPARNGWVYTLYSNDEHGPFVHALDAANGFAICIDLPTTGKDNTEAAFYWSLALTSGEGTLYAVNPALGQVVEIDALGATVRRTATFAPTATSRGPLARIADWLVPSAAAKRSITNGAALSADGATLYVLGDAGILVIDTRTLHVAQRLAPQTPFASLALSPDGARLYTIGSAPAQVAELRDPTTGALLRQYSGVTNPWAILRIERSTK